MHLFLAFVLYVFGVMFWVGVDRNSIGTPTKKVTYLQYTFSIILNFQVAHMMGLIPVAILAAYLREWWLFPAVILFDITLSHMWWFMGSRRRSN